MTSSYEILPNDQQTRKYTYTKRHFSHLDNFQTYSRSLSTLERLDTGMEF